MRISFGNRSRWVESGQLHRYVNKDGLVFWEFRFPATQAELFADPRSAN
jgi:hypothetical protein